MARLVETTTSYAYNTETLKEGQLFGCMVNHKGELHYFVDGKDKGLACTGMPMEQPLWDFADVYGKARKIRSETYSTTTHQCLSCSQLEQQMKQLRHEASQEQDDSLQRVQDLQQRVNEATQQLQQQRDEAAQELQEQRDEAARELQQQRDEAARELQQQREETAQELQQQRDEAAQELQELRDQAAMQQQASQRQLQLLQCSLDTVTAELEQLRSTPPVTSQEIESCIVPRREVQILSEMDRGAWGTVAQGKFQGQIVAVKWPHPAILNEHTVERLRREVRILAHVRHPNLLRFIAAVFDDQVPYQPPLIITGLLDTNLRKAYENGRLLNSNKVPIFRDVAYALHYLHDYQQPIIHRDVSAPNVLMKELPNGMWKAKVSDFGSANLASLAQTMGEGAIIYAAPETNPLANPGTLPPPQSTKIDVYSYGVLLCEVVTTQFPDPAQYQGMLLQIRSQWLFMYELIVRCTKRNPDERPTMAQVLDKLNELPHYQRSVSHS